MSKKKEYAPIYIQASNPPPALLKFIRECAEDGIIIYFQSGKPGHPPCGGPGQPPC